LFYASLAVLAVLFLMACFPQLFTSLSPEDTHLEIALSSSHGKYILGCDWLGRDLYTRLVYGARYSLLIGVVVSFITVIVPLLFSSFLFFAPQLWDHFYLMVLDVFQAFPPLLLAILVAASLDLGVFNVILALVLSGWAGNARIIRFCIRKIRSEDYVLSAQAVGAGNFRIFFRHVLPNLYSTLIVLLTIRVGGMILAESTLAFLGLGAVDAVSWGNMVNGGKDYLTSAWQVAVYPASMIAISVFSFQMIGECLEKRY
jgi:peptide/nickel transport system permease protein